MCELMQIVDIVHHTPSLIQYCCIVRHDRHFAFDADITWQRGYLNFKPTIPREIEDVVKTHADSNSLGGFDTPDSPSGSGTDVTLTLL